MAVILGVGEDGTLVILAGAIKGAQPHRRYAIQLEWKRREPDV